MKTIHLAYTKPGAPDRLYVISEDNIKRAAFHTVTITRPDSLTNEPPVPNVKHFSSTKSLDDAFENAETAIEALNKRDGYVLLRRA